MERLSAAAVLHSGDKGMRQKEEATLLGKVKIDALRLFIEQQGQEVWHFKCPFPALVKSQRIILRHSRNYDFDLHDIVDWPLMPSFRHLVDPIVEEVKGLVNKEKVSAMFLADLPPQERILPHIDSGEFLEIPSRIHIPIQTNPDVLYRIGGIYIEDELDETAQTQILAKEIHMQTGEVWDIDNMSYHSVTNGGNTNRWHLIINIW
jgi:hypothetical protein